MLSENTKARRRKLNNVNIKVTFIAWLLEFIGSLVPPLILKTVGHEQVGIGAGEILRSSFYFVLLPLAYLINSSELKAAIVDENWFHAISRIFNRTKFQVILK